jgi:Sulfotransferase family
MAQSDFNAEALLARARAQCGLDDFGEDDFRPGLDRLIESCLSDGFVDPAGLPYIADTIVRILINRLRFEGALKQHPEILDEQIATPLFIIGPGRVGSTKLHRLLANATNVQSTPLWQVMNPVPFPDTIAGQPDPRIAATQAFCTTLEQNQPQLYAAIEPDALEPDEDPYMFDMTFMQLMFLAVANVPSYVEWIYRQDWDAAYRYYRKMLQFVQWQNGTSGIPMLLKGPSHTPHMDLLHKYFPDAKFVQIHRDPVTCVASMSKVVWMLHQVQPVPGLDRIEDSTRMQVLYQGHCLRENLRIRTEHPEISIEDYYYEDVRDDAAGLADKIFAFWGLHLSEESKQRMCAWEGRNTQHKLGRFQYTVAESGLDVAAYKASIRTYLDRFFPASRAIN